MNFERPNNTEQPHNGDDSLLDKKLTKRDFIRTSLGFAASAVLTKGIVEVLPKWEENPSPMDTNQEPVLSSIKEPILQDEELLNEEELETYDQFEESRESIDWKDFKKIKPNLSYKEIAPRLNIEHLRMPNDISKYGATTHEGKILRTLRYQNITDAVEDRYNLPRGILLAMIMEESTGVDLLPNARGDGGFGLCHMQGSTAHEYGLKTFHECDSLVCDGKDARSCKNSKGELVDHAGELSLFMKQNAQNRKALIQADERLNPLLNIDAAGRMLATGIAGPQLKGELSNLGPFQTSIARYAGAYNFKNYWNDILKNMKDLRNPTILKKIKEEFNKKNPDFKINGEKGDFDMYMEKFQEQHANYGLEEYKDLPKYEPKNSVAVLKSYKQYIS